MIVPADGASKIGPAYYYQFDNLMFQGTQLGHLGEAIFAKGHAVPSDALPVLKQFWRGIERLDNAECYQPFEYWTMRGKLIDTQIKLSVVSEHVADLVDSIKLGTFGATERKAAIYQARLIEAFIIACPLVIVLMMTCCQIRDEAEFAPSIAKVRKLIKANGERWNDLKDLLDWIECGPEIDDEDERPLLPAA